MELFITAVAVLTLIISLCSLFICLKAVKNMSSDFNNKQDDLTEMFSLQQESLQKAVLSGQDEIQKTISSGQNDIQKTVSLGHENIQKTISLGQESIQKAITLGNDSTQKTLTLGQENTQKALALGRENTQKALTLGQENTQKTISSGLIGIQNTISSTMTNQEQRFKSFTEQNEQRFKSFTEQQEKRFQTFAAQNDSSLNQIRKTVGDSLTDLRQENSRKLDDMRKIVDEKLQDSVSRSFKMVNERLEQVYKGLGEMQNLAAGVGDLKKVLTNVKTRGILGEIQLGAILEEIMSPEQYDTNVRIKKDSRETVEYAVKIPSAADDSFIYLPIDSKFPGDTYAKLLDAYDTGIKENVDLAAKELLNRIKSEAKDIHDKYIAPPITTEFAVLFLPFEGLYCEAVNRGLVEELQRRYRVNIAGPSTMAAFLNSLQMGFKTVAIQKRSTEVWEVLGAVKTEFDKFDNVLVSARNRIRQADDDLEKLVSTRSNVIRRKLRNVTELSSEETKKLLED
ncbi:MAG: DNA recombination protein RmuC [Clostridiales bacterium]|nr:DNA recombination protein RmuC [Clostridiales bacterium]